jgi:hypothetical protein
MSMITELFGLDILKDSKENVIKKINSLPPTQQERRNYLLHDWAAATGQVLTADDFKAVKQ